MCRNINGLAGVVDLIFFITSILMDNKHLRFVFQEPETALNEIRKVFRKQIKF